MKALRFSKFGLPSVLRIEEIPRPEPRDGEALTTTKICDPACPMHARTGDYPTSARSTSRGGWLETPRLVSNPINTVKVVADAVAISNGRRVGA